MQIRRWYNNLDNASRPVSNFAIWNTFSMSFLNQQASRLTMGSPPWYLLTLQMIILLSWQRHLDVTKATCHSHIFALDCPWAQRQSLALMIFHRSGVWLLCVFVGAIVDTCTWAFASVWFDKKECLKCDLHLALRRGNKDVRGMAVNKLGSLFLLLLFFERDTD